MKKLAAFHILLLCLAAVSTLATRSYCWSNGGFSSNPYNPKYGTHDWIAEHALDWLPAEAKQWILANKALYLYGTELPDNGQASDGIGDTQRHHIYFYADGRLMDDSSAVRANATYRQTLTYMLEGDFASAAKFAGAMTHYISDVAVFGHVMGKNTPWGEEAHHEDYESYVNSKTSSYNAEFNVYLRFDGKLEVLTAYNAAVKLAYDTTFDSSGRGLTCVWMDQNYDWSNPTFRDRAGESLNLATNYVADILYTLYVEYTQETSAKLNETFDFTVSVTPAAAQIRKGMTSSFSVNVERVKGIAETTSLSVSGLPPGATSSFNVRSSQPPFASMLTITTSSNTPTGTYQIAVEASCGNLTKTAYISLTITDSEQQWSPEQILTAAFIFVVVIGVIGILLRLGKR